MLLLRFITLCNICINEINNHNLSDIVEDHSHYLDFALYFDVNYVSYQCTIICSGVHIYTRTQHMHMHVHVGRDTPQNIYVSVYIYYIDYVSTVTEGQKR